MPNTVSISGSSSSCTTLYIMKDCHKYCNNINTLVSSYDNAKTVIIDNSDLYNLFLSKAIWIFQGVLLVYF